MKISSRYQKTLDNYVLWSKCTTPFSHTLWGEAIVDCVGTEITDGYDAAESMFRFETYGDRKALSFCREPILLLPYYKGKANRDFWTKEKGWWDKYAAYYPEEFCGHLVPECFCELFGHWPRSNMVRYLHDNNYTFEMWLEAVNRRYRNGIEQVQGGIEICVL